MRMHESLEVLGDLDVDRTVEDQELEGQQRQSLQPVQIMAPVTAGHQLR